MPKAAIHELPSHVVREEVLKLAARHLDPDRPGSFNWDLRRGFGDLVHELRDRATPKGVDHKDAKKELADRAGIMVSDLTEVQRGTLSPESSKFFVRILTALGANQEDMDFLYGLFYPKMKDTELANWLDKEMERLDLTRVKLSRRSKVSEHLIEKIQRGLLEHPGLKVLTKLANGLTLGDKSRKRATLLSYAVENTGDKGKK